MSRQTDDALDRSIAGTLLRTSTTTPSRMKLSMRAVYAVPKPSKSPMPSCPLLRADKASTLQRN